MPVVKLVSPLTYSVKGRLFKRDTDYTDLDDDMVAYLKATGRFSIDGAMFDPTDLPSILPTAEEPILEDLNILDQIRLVADDVSVDDDANFHENGLPTAAAVSALLGTDVTDEKVLEAMSGVSPAQPAADAAEPVQKKPVRIKAKKAETTES